MNEVYFYRKKKNYHSGNSRTDNNAEEKQESKQQAVKWNRVWANKDENHRRAKERG